jgi:hypothetical protein
MDMIMDTDALENEGPFSSHQTSDIIQSGSYSPILDHAQYDVVRPGVTAPQGGIDYIDQAVGGVSGLREDVAVNGGIGVFSYRSRTQPFNGDYISARIPFATRDQGYVGLQRGGTGQRAAMPNMTNLPDSGDVTAAFSNPALAALLQKMRGGR